MARKALGSATMRVAQAVAESVGGYRHELLVACSGGADSLALAAGAMHVAQRNGLRVRGVIIDHGLQADSAGVAGRAREELQRLGMTARVERVRVDLGGGLGVEAAARAARYSALDELAGRARANVLLGHTLDDQAETVLLGLTRGSGIRSLAGIAKQRAHYVRPLLGLRRRDTEAACAELGIRAWHDPHNADPVFTRARVRHRVLPLLEAELGPGIAEALARTAELATADADYLDRACAEARSGVVSGTGGKELACQPLAELHPALRRRVLRRWLLERGAQQPSLAHVRAVEGLILGWRGQRWVEVSGLKVIRDADQLRAVTS